MSGKLNDKQIAEIVAAFDRMETSDVFALGMSALNFVFHDAVPTDDYGRDVLEAFRRLEKLVKERSAGR